MTAAPQTQPGQRKFQLTTDGWAVIAALALALLVKVGAIQRVPW